MSLLASQLPDRTASAQDPHRRLMAAVLQAVIDDVRGSRYRHSRGFPSLDSEADRAASYVASTDRTWPFSFENVCEALGLDVDCLRAELQRISDRP